METISSLVQIGKLWINLSAARISETRFRQLPGLSELSCSLIMGDKVYNSKAVLGQKKTYPVPIGFVYEYNWDKEFVLYVYYDAPILQLNI